jgi:hypothetical protein
MRKLVTLGMMALLLAGLAAAQEATTGTTLPTAMPAGTTISIKLETPIATYVTKVGDQFSGRVTQAVVVNGVTVVPVGASVIGQVTRLKEQRRYRGRPEIDLRPETIVMPDGKRYAIHAAVVDTDQSHLDVDDEGRVKGPGHENSDIRNAAIGTGAGLTVGPVAGGGSGALWGTAVGASASAVYWLVKKRGTEIPAGSELTMELNRAVELRTVEAD